MITSAFITKLRREYNDLPERHRDVRDGDGSSTVYKTKFAPIKEGSFGLYVDNALQNVSEYSVDLDTGDITTNSAPGNGKEVRAQYQSVMFRDQHWLEFIQGAIEELGDEFFRMVLRSTTAFSLSAGVTVYDCPTGCVRVTEALESDDFTTSGNFRAISPGVNIRYDRRSNKLVIGRKPTRGNYAMLTYARRVAIPEAVTEALDVEDNWLKLLNIKVGEISTRSYADRIAKQGNATVEEGHLSVATLRTLANDLETKFENRKKRIKPILPASTIQFLVHGGGKV